MHHGHWSYCSSGECVVCNTPWPEKSDSPTIKHLKSQGYYEKYRSVYFPGNAGDGLDHVGGVFPGGWLEFPAGISGQDLVMLRKQLNDEYKTLEGKSGGLQECKKRGALEGTDVDNLK